MRSTRIPHYLYTASLFFLIFLTAACIAISAADIIIQALANRSESDTYDYRNLFVVAASYVFLDIPKIYIPIRQDDLPKKVYMHIQSKFDKVKEYRKQAEPRREDMGQIGRAMPGNTLFEGVDFKRAIARTPTIIEKAALELNPDFSRPPYVPVKQYIEFLIQHNLIDSQLGPVYVDGYERARFSQAPVSQDEYLDIMKHLAAILRYMGYYLKNNLQNATALPSHSTTNQQQSFSLLYDDDVASLAQSIATWTSRSTSNTNTRHSKGNRGRGAEDGTGDEGNENDNVEDQEDEDDTQRILFEKLLIDRLDSTHI